MTTIFEIENIIKDMIKEDLDNVNIYLGTPQSFLNGTNNNKLPCILVSYTGAEPYKDLYPGTLSFSVFFLNKNFKDSREEVYQLMEKVFDKLQHSLAEKLNSGLKLRADKLDYEDINFLIFSQQWTCTELI
jgi:transposase